MIESHGWYLPAHEVHLPEWFSHPKNRIDVEDGRVQYQGKKQRAAMELCQSFRVAVDVGGHCGTWSWNLAKRFQQVVAFEPVAEHRECFLRNVTAENVILHACALGDQEGTVRVETTPGSSGDSHVAGGGDIPLLTLDSFELQDVDFVKIDVEGFEEMVVRGALETLQRCRPLVVIEQKGHSIPHFGLQADGALKLLESIGMKSLRPAISGDWFMGFGQ